MNFQCVPYQSLIISQLYDILQLRQRVFIQEQQSIYDDIDGLDESSFHVLATENNQLIGYLRFRSVDDVVKFERVVTAQSARGQGLGKALFVYALEQQKRLLEASKLQLSAQLEVVHFYQQFGFEPVGETYDDGGIEHVDMICKV